MMASCNCAALNNIVRKSSRLLAPLPRAASHISHMAPLAASLPSVRSLVTRRTLLTCAATTQSPHSLLRGCAAIVSSHAGTIPHARFLAAPIVVQVRGKAENKRKSDKRPEKAGPVLEPYKFKKLLIVMTSYDEPMIESFAKQAGVLASRFELNKTQEFSMPPELETIRSQTGDIVSSYELKKRIRVIELSDVGSDKFDLYCDMLRDKLPAGVDIRVEPKRWEMEVSPKHITMAEQPPYI